MSKTWQLLKKEHRRLRLWWWVWWLLVLSDAVLRYTQAAYVGDHGLEGSMRLYEQAFPWLAMGLSVLIIGLCHLEESPVAKPSFGQGLPLSPMRLFLVKTGLLLGHLIVLPALVEWTVCLGEGFGPHSPWLVLDWMVDRLPILCACVTIAAIAGNMGIYVVLLVLVKGGMIVAPLLSTVCARFFSPSLAVWIVGGTIILVLGIAFCQYRMRRQLKLEMLLWVLSWGLFIGLWPSLPMIAAWSRTLAGKVGATLITRVGSSGYGFLLNPALMISVVLFAMVLLLGVAYHQYRTRRRLRSSVLLVALLLISAGGLPFIHLRLSGPMPWASAPAEIAAGAATDKGIMLRPDPALKIEPSPWSRSDQEVKRWLLSEGLLPVVSRAYADLLEIDLSRSSNPARQSLREAHVVAEWPLKVGAVEKEGWGLQRIEEISWGRNVQLTLLDRAVPEAYTVYQNLLPRMGRGFVGRYVLLNRRRGIAMELHSRYDSKNERSERFLDWKVRRQRNHRVTLKGRESSLRLDAERWSPDETTLVLVGWKPTTKTVSRIPVPPIFSFTRATSSMGDEAPLLLMWPDRKDREAVRAYLEYILEHEGRGWDWLPQSELVIRAFAGVGRENLDLLVACGLSLPPDSNRNREVVSAIGRLAREEDRDLVCSALCPNLDLLSLILERGWEGHAREAILETALANPFAISLRWVEHLVTLDDPRAADSLWKRAVHGEWSPAIYDVVVGAGMNLSDKIAQQCEVAEIFGDTRGLLISLRSGHPGAIERLSRYSQSLKSAEGPVLKLMRERSPFDGENEDLDAWLKTNREQLVFSTEKQAYILKGDVN